MASGFGPGASPVRRRRRRRGGCLLRLGEAGAQPRLRDGQRHRGVAAHGHRAGYRIWPAVALGAFLANSWTGVPVYAVLGITIGNTLEALAGAYLLRRLARF